MFCCYSCYCILECYNLFSGVKLSMFYLLMPIHFKKTLGEKFKSHILNKYLQETRSTLLQNLKSSRQTVAI